MLTEIVPAGERTVTVLMLMPAGAVPTEGRTVAVRPHITGVTLQGPG